jgi:hypothetical protein
MDTPAPASSVNLRAIKTSAVGWIGAAIHAAVLV